MRYRVKKLPEDRERQSREGWVLFQDRLHAEESKGPCETIIQLAARPRAPREVSGESPFGGIEKTMRSISAAKRRRIFSFTTSLVMEGLW